MRDVTLLFLIERSSKQNIERICLAMKKRGFGEGRWNGVGGKLEGNESLEDGARREAQEEIGITPKHINKVAELHFQFIHGKSWEQMVHTYICEDWHGEPVESDEMAPEWFHVSDIPFHSMWPDDIHWLPHVLKDKHIIAKFVLGKDDVIHEQQVEILENHF